MAQLRKAMRLVIKEQLVVLTGESTVEASEHRAQMMGLFLRGRAPKDMYRRKLMENLFNGDWRVEGQVQYHDRGQIVGGRRAIEKAMYLYGVRSLLPRALRVLSRNNWTGTGPALDDLGIASCVHGLLGASFAKMLSWSDGDAGRGGRGAPMAIADVDDNDSDYEDWSLGGQGGGDAARGPYGSDDPKSL